MASGKLIIYTDGASRGNPGPAAIGVVIQDAGGKAVATISRCLGHATNNQAEYRAIIAGLEKALALGATRVELCSDSELVVYQLAGKYRVKNEALKPLFTKVEELRRRLAVFEVSYIPREKNAEADRLANQALDNDKPQQPSCVSGINPRKATTADYPALIAIIEELEKQHIEGVPQFFCRESYEEQIHDLDTIIADEKAALMVVEKTGEILGYINMTLREEEKHPGIQPRRYVKIRDLAVARKHQRSGAGRVLMQTAENWAREKGLDTIELNVWEFNHGAFTFYQKMGYTTASRHMWKQI